MDLSWLAGHRGDSYGRITMNDMKVDPNRLELRSATPSLTAAIRRARMESVERSDVVAELRGAEMARLEILSDALKPVLEQVPEGIDLFDQGIVPGEHPRLFVDMIGFVEMGRDRRQYRFLQDSRHGRLVIVESERIDVMVEAITNYIARRLVERERALVADRTVEEAARAYLAQRPMEVEQQERSRAAAAPIRLAPDAAPGQLPPTTPSVLRPPRRRRHKLMRGLAFIIEYLGVVTLLLLILGSGYFGYHYAREKWFSPTGGLAPAELGQLLSRPAP
jgi:hypothetical protein